MSRDVVLFQTHDLSTPVLDTFEEIRAGAPDGLDPVLLLDRAGGREPPPALRGDTWCYEGDRLAAEVGRRSLPGGYTNLPVLAFHGAHPGYARYWMIEYDVRFTGPWSALFTHFAPATADLLATVVRRYRPGSTWYWWDRSVETPGGALPMEERIAAFMPVCRYSEHALRVLAETYSRGWRAHAELLVPSVLHRAGLRLRDLGGAGEWVEPGDRDRFYIAPPGEDLEDEGRSAPCTLRWRPPFRSAGPLGDKLYHPVKQEGAPPPWIPRWLALREDR